MPDFDYLKGGLLTPKYLIHKWVPCELCDGTGRNAQVDLSCGACHGRGGYPVQVDPEASYFVLRYDADPNARAALLTYSESIRPVNDVLADDLLRALATTEDRFQAIMATLPVAEPE